MTRHPAFLAALAILAGCAPEPPPAPVRTTIPADLETCPDAPLAPPPLPRFRTPEQLRAHDEATEVARRRTGAALAECADRLKRRNALEELL